MLSVVGRLRPGVTIEHARQEISAIALQLRQEHPKEDAELGVAIRSLTDDLLGDVRRPILVLFAAVCAVLLVGCANVANLMLSRATSRRRELAVRVALGAPPGVIARQLFTESVLIAVVSGVLGVAIAFGATRALSGMLPEAIAKVGRVHVDGRVLAFTLGVCILVALLCGIAPAVRAARGATRDALADAARSSSRGRAVRRFHASLVVAELALALVLAASAGLLINSFAHLSAIDPGFRTDHLIRMKIALLETSYRRGAQTDQFFETLLRDAASLPGARSAALISRFPLHDGPLTSSVLVEGAAYAEGDRLPSVQYRMASPGLFATMGIPMLAGREFLATDKADSTAQLVAVINRTAAVRLFGTGNAVGRRFRFGRPPQPLFTVVGVVGDIHDLSLREPPSMQVYVSSRQGLPSAGSIVIRYDGARASIIEGVRGIVRSLDKTLPVYDVQSIEDVMVAASVGERFTTSLLSSFAILALVLAALGTYGVIAYGVAERTREIGVRMALGARSGDVLAMVLRQGMLLFAIALPIAFAGVWWSNRALAGLLFGVVASDPATIAAAVGTLAVATAVACLVPALRASRIDPTVAIKA
ncbi:MAG TPA: FtsX-like permease family protein, partial [Gemmatimonadaceae bacterium]|nr:FtsX-like permease family protein [Gemmatimonadaceae bacterium]